jgi:signal transduction histidine kinase/CheY-like chemotaxis protein
VGSKPVRALRPQPEVSPEEVLQAFADMGHLQARGSTGGETLRLQLGRTAALLKATAAWLAVPEPDSDLLRVEVVRGRSDARITAAQVGRGAVGRAFSEARVVREADTLAAPLQVRGRAVGCLCLLAPRRIASDALLEALAAQLAGAWEVARLRDEAQRRTKDLETALAGLKSLEHSREVMLGNISHGLKTPLTPIKAYLGMLTRQKLGPLTEGQRNAVQVVDRNADRLLRMVNDLILMSRLQAGKMQLGDKPIGLKALAEEAVRALAPVAEIGGVRLRLAPSTEVFVRGDRQHLLQAVNDLLENGLARTRKGDTVEVEVDAGEGLALLTVRDSGPAMPAEELSHVFDAFARSRGRSRLTGLGLPLVAKVAQLHGGRTEAASQSGEGSTFRLVLPMFAGALGEQEAPAAAPRAGGILLVEDDPDSREVLADVLGEEGYRVMAVDTASAALALLTHIRPAMVLLDLKLRDEDGRTVLHQLRRTPSLEQVPVYIISGASDLGALTAGTGLDRVDGIFEKPLQLGRLLDQVASVVRPSRPTVVR